jgi:sigma-E factor negative regulatory protein RseB
VRRDRLLPVAGRRRLLLALLLAIVSAPALGAVADARTWLARMDEALLERDYEGEFTYLSGDRLTSLRIVHAVVDGVQRERLVHLDGPPREILRRGDVVTCVLEPGDEMLALSKSIPAGPFARSFGAPAAEVPDDYVARLGGVGRVADRRARRLDVVPRDEHRYGYRLWLDEATGLLLRSELRDVDGTPLEIFQFVRIAVGGPIPVSALEPAGDGDEIRHRLTFADGAAAARPSDGGWAAGWLPDGFTMTAADVRRVPMRDRDVHTLRYSDGLATFSVFIEPTWGEASWGGKKRRGATSAVMREVRVDAERRYLVTVVGEVPLPTAERVAANVAAGG